VARWDVIVVGAGPAGSAAALTALQARPGARVLLLDKAAFPRDKACGDGIAPHALEELARLGLPDLFADAVPIPALRLEAPSGTAAAGALQAPTRVIPRTVFDARLVDAAVARGAVLRRSRVRMLTQGRDQVLVNDSDRAPVVVAADGANSTVRRLLEIPPSPPQHTGVAVRGYASDGRYPLEQRIVIDDRAWPSYAWAFPVGDGTVNVGFGLLRDGFVGGKAELHGRLAELLPDLPADPDTLRAHHLPLSPARPDPARGRVLLAGDAASLINPLTGEGIYYALLSGRLAANAALTAPHDPAAAYRAALRAELGRHLRHTTALAKLVRYDGFVDAAITVARDSPQAFWQLVELGLGRGLVPARLLASIARAYVTTLGGARRPPHAR
jgi:geranylgeranyl reductase family protein